MNRAAFLEKIGNAEEGSIPPIDKVPDEATKVSPDEGMKESPMPEENPEKETEKPKDDGIVKDCEDAFKSFVDEAKDDPKAALDILINKLTGLKDGMSNDESPLNVPPIGGMM